MKNEPVTIIWSYKVKGDRQILHMEFETPQEYQLFLSDEEEIGGVTIYEFDHALKRAIDQELVS